MQWKKFTDQLPEEDKPILVGYKNDIFLLNLKVIKQITVEGGMIKHYYLNSILHGGWFKEFKYLALNPHMEWAYPCEMPEKQEAIPSNLIYLEHIDINQ